ncbi:MAG: mechanosensitive ion channel [Planctomycetes bacterium]|nr:mechanosensitive ion channel [Planctomycetota bacterium]
MDIIKDWLIRLGLGEETAVFGVRVLAIVIMLGVACIAYIIAKRFLLRVVKSLVERSKTIWDDILLERKVFNRFSYFAPALVIFWMAPFVLSGSSVAIATLQLAAKIYMVIVGLLVFDSFLNSVVEIYRTFEFSQKKPIRGFVQGAKIILFFLGGIFILAMIMGKSPVIVLGGLGAMMAVFMLIFKDSVLGFVAGIQLSANRMIHIGDWIEMPKYGADGSVIDIALTTVKVQNWDKTIATIPTYALISDSFKNWRGMSESGGRRIKRAIYIDMSSVKFCTEEMLQKFKKFKYISEYTEKKVEEIKEHNFAAGVDESELVNGRHLTNIGTFRAYVAAYLRNHPKIHQDMTFLVRHLEPTPNGLPIQIYVFSNDQVWANYEAIQADIFDHILAVIPKFELRIFQNPTGADLQNLAHPVNA